MRGFLDVRSELQPEVEVMLEAKEVMVFVQDVTLAAHVTSRVWDILVMLFAAWKKDREFWEGERG